MSTPVPMPGRPSPTPRGAGWVLLLVAALLAVWAGWLGRTLPVTEHRWHWVGLDSVEVGALAATGVLLVLGRRWLGAVAALASAPLFLYDAVLDFVSGHGSTSDLLLALAMGVFAELPMMLFLLWAAGRCVRPARRRLPSAQTG